MALHVWFLVLFLLVSKLTIAQQGPSCEAVYEYFPYCLEFLMGLYYKPSKKCCDHIEKLNKLAKHTKKDPQRLCWCIESMVEGRSPPLLASRIDDLPIKCHTHLSFPISESMDCSKV